MRILLKILFLVVISVSVKAQAPAPSGFPAPYSAAYYRIGWMQTDSGSIPAYKDTNWIPKFQGTEILWLHAGVDTAKWIRIGVKWVKELKAGDVPNLTATIPIVYLNGNISCPTCGTGGSGIAELNGLTATTQTFAIGSSGVDFNILSSGSAHTFNIPDGGPSARGLLTTALYNTFNTKQPQINGTGFVVATGTNISFDNTVYYPNSNPSSFIPRTGISALAPISYNNSTGVFSADTSTGNTHFATQAYVLAHQSNGTLTGAGNLSPLFTTSIVSNTIVFTISTAAAGSILGNNTGSTGPPAYFVPNSTTLNGWFGATIQTQISGTGYIKQSGTSSVFMTSTQVTADLNLFTSSLQGLVPLSGGGTTNFLRADGSWSAPPAGTVTSVSLAMPSIFGVSGSPVTSSGGFTVTLNTQSAYTGFGNWTASTAAPTFGKIPYQAFATGTANGILGFDGSGNPTILSPDTLFVRNRILGVGVIQIGNISSDTLYLNGLRAGTNMTITHNADSTITFASSGGFSDPLTTNGDIIARISGVTNRLAQGSNGTFLGVSGGVLGYYTPSSGGPFLDTLYRTIGKDSLQFTIGGRYHSILDSAGSGGGSQTWQQTMVLGNTTTTQVIAMRDTSKLMAGLLQGLLVGDSVKPVTDSLWIFGDSWTLGTGSTPTTAGYAYVTAAQYGCVLDNQGVNGSTMISRGDGLSMEERIPTIPRYNTRYKGLFFLFGVNDAHYALSSTTFITVYQKVIDTCIARGWPIGLIKIFSPGFNNGSFAATITTFVTATQTVATSRSLEWVNLYAAMVAQGESLLMNADSVHPNNTGSRFIAQKIATGITGLSFAGNAIVNGTLDVYKTTHLHAAYIGDSTEVHFGNILNQGLDINSTSGVNVPSLIFRQGNTPDAGASYLFLVHNNVAPTIFFDDSIKFQIFNHGGHPELGISINQRAPWVRYDAAGGSYYDGAQQSGFSYTFNAANGIYAVGIVSMLDIKVRGTTTVDSFKIITKLTGGTARTGFGVTNAGDNLIYAAGSAFVKIGTSNSGTGNVNTPIVSIGGSNQDMLVGSTTDDGLHILQVTGNQKLTGLMGFKRNAIFYANIAVCPGTSSIADFYLDTTASALLATIRAGTIEHLVDSLYYTTKNGVRTNLLFPANLATSDSTRFPANTGWVKRAIASGLTGVGGISRIAPLDSLTKDAKGIQVSGISLVPQSADGSFAGLVTTAAQTIAGTKTLTGAQFILGNTGTRTWNPNAAIPGSIFSIQTGTLNDATTSASTTVTDAVLNGISSGLLTATNSSVTYTNAYAFYVNGAPGASTNVTITNGYALGVGGPASFLANVYLPHSIYRSNTPGIAAGTGAGTSPTVSISGTDVDGDVTVTTGTIPVGSNATIATITFASGYSYPNHVYPMITPANALTAALSGITMVYTTGGTSSWVITSGTTALTAATTYVWHYNVSGN